MQNKIKELTSIGYNTIDITFNLTYICNFCCSYCVAGERNEKTFILNDESKSKLNFFIDSIYSSKQDVTINFLLCGGEPLVNKQYVEIIQFLLSFKNVTIETITNGFFILNFKDQIELLKNDRFNFYMTLHYNEYIKFDKIGIKYVETIKLLKNNNIIFKLNFLIPSERELFNNFRIIMNYIIDELKLGKHEYVINLIREDGKISKKYSKKVLKYYYEEKPKIVKKNIGKDIRLEYQDGSVKHLQYITEILESGMNNFRGFQCFPFSIPTNILMEPNLMISFASCTTMINRKFTIEEGIKLMKVGEKKIVICNTDFCECGSNLSIKKKLNKDYFDKISNINEILSNKVSNLLLIEGLKIKGLKVLFNSDKKGFLLSYYNKNNPNIFINFIIEEIQKSNIEKYMITGNFFGVYYYKANNQGGYIQDNIDGLESFNEKVLYKIKPIFPIFYSLVKIISK